MRSPVFMLNAASMIRFVEGVAELAARENLSPDEMMKALVACMASVAEACDMQPSEIGPLVINLLYVLEHETKHQIRMPRE